MKAKTKKMTQEEITEFLSAQPIGVLSLTNTQSAYGIPVGFSYDGKDISLAIHNTGRKMEYIKACQNVCFTVFWLQENFNPRAGASFKSVICDGVLEQVTEPDDITRAIRIGEKQSGLPEGSWDKMLERGLKDPPNSGFWKIKVNQIGGQSVEDFKEG